MTPILAMTIAVLLSSAPDAAPEPPTTQDLPKSNLLARAKVLSASERSITIKHSRWGEQTAFTWADAHCGKFGKAAVNIGSSPSGTSTISTWRCE